MIFFPLSSLHLLLLLHLLLILLLLLLVFPLILQLILLFHLLLLLLQVLKREVGIQGHQSLLKDVNTAIRGNILKDVKQVSMETAQTRDVIMMMKRVATKMTHASVLCLQAMHVISFGLVTKGQCPSRFLLRPNEDALGQVRQTS
uniref:Uncharacterized protein n=1 Tax=Cacopsylla melanoneura TaxID=428564 RepID=A0A8D8YAZ2_9HEMI